MTWRFLTTIEPGYGNDVEYCLFTTELEARRYIEREHVRRWDYVKDEFKQGLDFESAAVYEVLRGGRCKLVQGYTTVIADSSGEAEGWIDLERRAEIYGCD